MSKKNTLNLKCETRGKMKSAESRLLLILVLLPSIATNGCEIALRHKSEQIEAIAQDLESVDFSTPAQTQFAVANAANSPKAVMFVHLDWTMELPSVRIQFIDFMISYAEQFPGEDVSFHYIDSLPILLTKLFSRYPAGRKWRGRTIPWSMGNTRLFGC